LILLMFMNRKIELYDVTESRRVGKLLHDHYGTALLKRLLVHQSIVERRPSSRPTWGVYPEASVRGLDLPGYRAHHRCAVEHIQLQVSPASKLFTISKTSLIVTRSPLAMLIT